MNIKDFYQLVELELEPHASMLIKLQHLTKKYPFFQAGVFTYIKCLYLNDDETFQKELRRLAPFVLDRKALFYYVMNNEFRDFEKRAEKALTQDRTELLINAFFETLTDNSQEERELEHAIVNSSMASLDYFSFLESESSIQVETKSENIDLPEISDYTSLMLTELKSEDEILTSDDILKTETVIITEVEEEVETKTETEAETDIPQQKEEESVPALKGQSIIDSFISKAQNKEDIRIKLDKTASDTNYDEDYLDDDMDGNASEKELDDDFFFTQTLANIYIKQKKYDRAYEIIKRLSLNYPEKNTYFADQLSFLEKLIKNSNKKIK